MQIFILPKLNAWQQNSLKYMTLSYYRARTHTLRYIFSSYQIYFQRSEKQLLCNQQRK